MWEHDYKWVPLVPETNGYFNQMCHIYFFSAIASAFGIPTSKIDTNTQFHSKPYVFGIYDKTNIKNQFLGEIHKF